MLAYNLKKAHMRGVQLLHRGEQPVCVCAKNQNTELVSIVHHHPTSAKNTRRVKCVFLTVCWLFYFKSKSVNTKQKDCY